MSEQALMMKQIRPFWGRVTVMESPVDEEQTPAGIVLPTMFEGDDGIKRGVVLHVGASVPPWPDATEALQAGTVCFYRRGVKIMGVTVVDLADVVAFEAE